jgi:hypothetical protein
LLGFDQYQLLSIKGIHRYWAIQFLTQNLLEFQRLKWSKPSSKLTLGDVVRRFRHEQKGQMLLYVFEQAVQKKPLFDILRDLKMIAYPLTPPVCLFQGLISFFARVKFIQRNGAGAGLQSGQ